MSDTDERTPVEAPRRKRTQTLLGVAMPASPAGQWGYGVERSLGRLVVDTGLVGDQNVAGVIGE